MAVILDVTGLADYTPYEGLGGSDLLSHDGKFHALIQKCKIGKSKEGREMLTLACVIKDADNEGKTVVHNVTIGGVDKNNKPMVRGLGDLLTSLGHPVTTIRNMATNKQIDLEKLVKTNIEGKDCFIECAAEVYEERVSSKVRNLISKPQYDEAVAVKAHRKAHTFNGGAQKVAGGAAPKGGDTLGGGGLGTGLGGPDVGEGDLSAGL